MLMTPQRQTENDKNYKLGFNNHLNKFETLHFDTPFAYI